VPDPVEREVVPHVRRGQGGRTRSANATSSAAITASANSGAGMSDAEIARRTGVINNRRDAGQWSDIRGSVTPGSDTPRDTIVSNAEAEEMGRRVLGGGGGDPRATTKTSPAGVQQTGTNMGFDWDKFGRDVRNPFTSVQLPETSTQANPALNGQNADAFDPANQLGKTYANAETMGRANVETARAAEMYKGSEVPFDTQVGSKLLGEYAGGSHAGHNHAPGEHGKETKPQMGVNGTDFSRDYGNSMTSAPMTDERRRARDAFLNAEDSVMGVRASEDTMGIGYAGQQHMLRTGEGKDDYVKVSKEGVRAYKDGRINAQELKDGYVTDIIGGKKDIPPSPSEAQNPGVIDASGKAFPSQTVDNGLNVAGPQREEALSNFQTVNLDPDQKRTEWAFNNPGVVPTGASQFDPLNKGITGSIWS